MASNCDEIKSFSVSNNEIKNGDEDPRDKHPSLSNDSGEPTPSSCAPSIPSKPVSYASASHDGPASEAPRSSPVTEFSSRIFSASISTSTVSSLLSSQSPSSTFGIASAQGQIGLSSTFAQKKKAKAKKEGLSVSLLGTTQKRSFFPGRPRPRSRKTHIGFGMSHKPTPLMVTGTINEQPLQQPEPSAIQAFVPASAEVLSNESLPSPTSSNDKVHSSFSFDNTDPDSGVGLGYEKALSEESYSEQWPGRTCSFCNLGERSVLGQGELTKFDPTPGFNVFKRTPGFKIRRFGIDTESGLILNPSSSSIIYDKNDCNTSPKPAYSVKRKEKSCGRNFVHREKSKFMKLVSEGSEEKSKEFQAIPVDELSQVGFSEEPDVSFLFENGGHTFAHHCCAAWSDGVCQTDDYVLVNVDKAVFAGSSQKCSSCNHYGATIKCRVSKCNKNFHYPCAATSDCFQDIKTMSLLCPEHLFEAPAIAGTEAQCVVCDSPGAIADQLFCTSCGHHYHGPCLDPPVDVNPTVRAGWQCPDCKICQTCRKPGDDNKMLMCDVCDKGFHIFCLKPAMSSVPKQGWKCKNCRICMDCGSRTPGAGPSSRWHKNYTICDGCYQQRNKGLACPICHRAYRHFSSKEMLQCNQCKKCTHLECNVGGKNIDRSEYICPLCLNPPKDGIETSSCSKDSIFYSHDSNQSLNEDSTSSMDADLQGSQLSSSSNSASFDYETTNTVVKTPETESKLILHLSNISQMAGKFPGKKKMPLTKQKSNPKLIGKKRAKTADLTRRCHPKNKFKSAIFGSTGNLQADLYQNKSDDEPGDNKIILCSADDRFVLCQDVCVMCGSFGKEEEGNLIACAQCGQCYHPYCVNVKVTNVVLTKGWRCLDCTVCEGCGQPHDEGRLILCDECDISYHIYCLDPPLATVPQGTWKCKWCVVCLECGATTPGIGSVWQNNYTVCGPCASQVCCPVCVQSYTDKELVLQCINCDRWVHGKCDQVLNNDQAEKASDCGYSCVLCRPKGLLPAHLLCPPSPPKIEPILKNPSPIKLKEPELVKPRHQIEYMLDGVCLSETGMHQIKALTLDQPKKHRMRKTKPPVNPIPGPLGENGDDAEANKSLPSDSMPSDSFIGESDIKTEGDDDYPASALFPALEEGATIKISEDGTVLPPPVTEKKKRVRNLQKLGIGGFIAKPRRNTGCKEGISEKLEPQPGVDIDSQGNPVDGGSVSATTPEGDKPKRKRRSKKSKNPVAENYPSYLQEAFFGKELLVSSKEHEPSLDDESNEDDVELNYQSKKLANDRAILLGTGSDNLEFDKNKEPAEKKKVSLPSESMVLPTQKMMDDEDLGDGEAFRDILPLPQDLPPDEELVNMLMNEGDDLSKNSDDLNSISNVNQENLGDAIGNADQASQAVTPQESVPSTDVNKDDFVADLLDPTFNLDAIDAGFPQMDSKDVEDAFPQMDSKDVEDVFKGVLSPDASESLAHPAITERPCQPVIPTSTSPGIQMPNAPPLPQPNIPQNIQASHLLNPQQSSVSPNIVRPEPAFVQPPSTPFNANSEFSSSPQFSPQFDQPPASPWTPSEQGDGENQGMTYNQRNFLKWESDEMLGHMATISPVLYANLHHPEFKIEYPTWSERAKHITKAWRSLSAEKRQPFLQKARENRTANRISKQQADAAKNNNKTPKETEQEKHWKQFQVIRQQQLQHQQTQQQSMLQDQINLGGPPNQFNEKSPTQPDSTPGGFNQMQVQNQRITSSMGNIIQVSRVHPPIESMPQMSGGVSPLPNQMPNHPASIGKPVAGQPGPPNMFAHPQSLTRPATNFGIRPDAYVHRRPMGPSPEQLNSSNVVKPGIPMQGMQPQSPFGQIPKNIRLPVPNESINLQPPPSPSVQAGDAFIQNGKQMRPQMNRNNLNLALSPITQGQPDSFGPRPPGPVTLGQQLNALPIQAREAFIQNRMVRPQMSSPDPYNNPPRTPRPQINTELFSQPPGTPKPNRSPDPYSQPPGTPRQAIPQDIYSQPPSTPRQDVYSPSTPRPQTPQEIGHPAIKSSQSNEMPLSQFPQNPQVPMSRVDANRQWSPNMPPHQSSPSMPSNTKDTMAPMNFDQQKIQAENKLSLNSPSTMESFNLDQPVPKPLNIPSGMTSAMNPSIRSPNPSVHHRPPMDQVGMQQQQYLRAQLTQKPIPGKDFNTSNESTRNQLRDLLQKQKQEMGSNRMEMPVQQPGMNMRMRIPVPDNAFRQPFPPQGRMHLTQPQPGQNPMQPGQNLMQPGQNSMQPGQNPMQPGIRQISDQQTRMLLLQQQMQNQIRGQMATTSSLQTPVSGPGKPTIAGIMPPQNPNQEGDSSKSNIGAENKEMPVSNANSALASSHGPRPNAIGNQAASSEGQNPNPEDELDDDELLGLGNDFNILEYADPELDNVLYGSRDKNNILDEQLDLVEKEDQEEKRKIKSEPNDPRRATTQPTPFNSNRPVLNKSETTQSKPIKVENDPNNPSLITHNQACTSSSKVPKIENFVPESRLNPSLGNVPSPQVNQVRLPPPPYQTQSSVQPLPTNAPKEQQIGQVGAVLQDQPLLIEDLLEQEKKEQQQQQNVGLINQEPMLSDHDFEKLKADVLGSNPAQMNIPVSEAPMTHMGPRMPLTRPRAPHMMLQRRFSQPGNPGGNVPPDWQMQSGVRFQNMPPRNVSLGSPRIMGQMQGTHPPHMSPMLHPALQRLSGHGGPSGLRSPGPGPGQNPPYQNTVIPPPSMPPLEPQNETERQQKLQYEQWLHQQQQVISVQQKYFETEIAKIRKAKKSLTTKQRQLKKNGSELTENDARELERIIQELAPVQKQLDQIRKQSRQHAQVFQDYSNKMMKLQPPMMASQNVGPVVSPQHQPAAMMHSPAMLPPHSPLATTPGTPQSPHMSPSPIGNVQSPLMQNSPTPMMQSPVTVSPSAMVQPSPHSSPMRIPTTPTDGSRFQHPQDENNPFSDSFQRREHIEKIRAYQRWLAEQQQNPQIAGEMKPRMPFPGPRGELINPSHPAGIKPTSPYPGKVFREAGENEGAPYSGNCPGSVAPVLNKAMSPFPFNPQLVQEPGRSQTPHSSTGGSRSSTPRSTIGGSQESITSPKKGAMMASEQAIGSPTFSPDSRLKIPGDASSNPSFGPQPLAQNIGSDGNLSPNIDALRSPGLSIPQQSQMINPNQLMNNPRLSPNVLQQGSYINQANTSRMQSLQSEAGAPQSMQLRPQNFNPHQGPNVRNFAPNDPNFMGNSTQLELQNMGNSGQTLSNPGTPNPSYVNIRDSMNSDSPKITGSPSNVRIMHNPDNQNSPNTPGNPNASPIYRTDFQTSPINTNTQNININTSQNQINPNISHSFGSPNSNISSTTQIHNQGVRMMSNNPHGAYTMHGTNNPENIPNPRMGLPITSRSPQNSPAMHSPEGIRTQGMPQNLRHPSFPQNPGKPHPQRVAFNSGNPPNPRMIRMTNNPNNPRNPFHLGHPNNPHVRYLSNNPGNPRNPNGPFNPGKPHNMGQRNPENINPNNVRFSGKPIVQGNIRMPHNPVGEAGNPRLPNNASLGSVLPHHPGNLQRHPGNINNQHYLQNPHNPRPLLNPNNILNNNNPQMQIPNIQQNAGHSFNPNNPQNSRNPLNSNSPPVSINSQNPGFPHNPHHLQNPNITPIGNKILNNPRHPGIPPNSTNSQNSAVSHIQNFPSPLNSTTLDSSGTSGGSEQQPNPNGPQSSVNFQNPNGAKNSGVYLRPSNPTTQGKLLEHPDSIPSSIQNQPSTPENNRGSTYPQNTANVINQRDPILDPVNTSLDNSDSAQNNNSSNANTENPTDQNTQESTPSDNTQNSVDITNNSNSSDSRCNIQNRESSSRLGEGQSSHEPTNPSNSNISPQANTSDMINNPIYQDHLTEDKNHSKFPERENGSPCSNSPDQSCKNPDNEREIVEENIPEISDTNKESKITLNFSQPGSSMDSDIKTEGVAVNQKHLDAFSDRNGSTPDVKVAKDEIKFSLKCDGSNDLIESKPGSSSLGSLNVKEETPNNDECDMKKLDLSKLGKFDSEDPTPAITDKKIFIKSEPMDINLNEGPNDEHLIPKSEEVKKEEPSADPTPAPEPSTEPKPEPSAEPKIEPTTILKSEPGTEENAENQPSLMTNPTAEFDNRKNAHAKFMPQNSLQANVAPSVDIQNETLPVSNTVQFTLRQTGMPQLGPAQASLFGSPQSCSSAPSVLSPSSSPVSQSPQTQQSIMNQTTALRTVVSSPVVTTNPPTSLAQVPAPSAKPMANIQQIPPAIINEMMRRGIPINADTINQVLMKTQAKQISMQPGLNNNKPPASHPPAATTVASIASPSTSTQKLPIREPVLTPAQISDIINRKQPVPAFIVRELVSRGLPVSAMNIASLLNISHVSGVPKVSQVGIPSTLVETTGARTNPQNQEQNPNVPAGNNANQAPNFKMEPLRRKPSTSDSNFVFKHNQVKVEPNLKDFKSNEQNQSGPDPQDLLLKHLLQSSNTDNSDAKHADRNQSQSPIIRESGTPDSDSIQNQPNFMLHGPGKPTMGDSQMMMDPNKGKRKKNPTKTGVPRQKKDGFPGGQPKKRSKKGPAGKPELDYDTFISNLMSELRRLPGLGILEPEIPFDFNAVPVFGSGNMNAAESRLKGASGSAVLPGQPECYSVYPFGDDPPTPPVSLPPTPPPHRGFYNQEFPPYRNDDLKYHILPDGRHGPEIPSSFPTPPPTRDANSPESVLSSSSPECFSFEPVVKYPGLQLIDDGDDDPLFKFKSVSPNIPLFAPIPIRAIRALDLDNDEKDKENIGAEMSLKPRISSGSHSGPLKDTGNIGVTLTLNATASEDIRGVLNSLADLLKIPAPSSYKIIERTTTPPSQRLGLYKKVSDKESAASIQSVLNGKPSFCRHCDIVVLSAGIKKKVSELPSLARDDSDDAEVIFCSTNCYMQFAITHRANSCQEKEAAAVVSHLSDIFGPIKPNPDEAHSKLDNVRPDAVDNGQAANKNLEIDQNKTEAISSNVESTKDSVALPAEEIMDTSIKTDATSPSRKKHLSSSEKEEVVPLKKWKDVKWKKWSGALLIQKKPEAINSTILSSMEICVKPKLMPPDRRRCELCQGIGDGTAEETSRILNLEVNKWVHLNCALWSTEVYETVNGALMNVQTSCKRGYSVECIVCHKRGATVGCFKIRCTNIYHFGCARKDKCMFFKNKTILCPLHAPKTGTSENELTSVAVWRRVYIDRDENQQIAQVVQNGLENEVIRIGSLIFLNVGQLLPHQIQAFHTPNSIYPIGFKTIRMYWGIRVVTKRCQYVCSICDNDGKPEFRVVAQESGFEDVVFTDVSTKGVWLQIIHTVEKLKKSVNAIKVFGDFITGDELFGLTEPAILRIIESLPGVDMLSDYNFRYGRSPVLELPLAINPTGCARTEPKMRTHIKRPHTLHTRTSSRPAFQSTVTGFEVACPYTKQFVHSKSSQYRKMKMEWRNNVYLARSKIQGLGLYAARDIEKHTMIIEYIGQLIRNEVAESNERIYESQNRGVYMFRSDENTVIDATISGGLARYVNHSCNPNCVTETVQIDRENKILIIANTRIPGGTELCYDYKFDMEDDQHKLPCMCGAPNCRKWMN